MMCGCYYEGWLHGAATATLAVFVLAMVMSNAQKFVRRYEVD